MGLFIGSNQPSKIFVGDTPISKVFVGDTQVRPSGWQPGANTIAYYPLKEDVLDYSGNGNNATGNPNSFTGGVANYSGASTTLPTSIINANPRTVSCWVNDEGVGVGTHNISVYGQHTNANYGFCLNYNMENNDNTYRIAIVVSGGSGYATTNSVIYSYPTALTGWHHVVCMRDSSKAYLYVDGVYIGNTAYSGQTSSNTFYLGYDHGYDGGAWNGKISELIFEDKIRTAQEVSDYYNLTKNSYPATLNSLQNINLTPTNEINITPNNNGSGTVLDIK